MATETLLERKADMMIAEMDGETVMMDIDQGSYFAINQVGAHLWAQLETPKTIAALVTSVHEAFDSEDVSQISADVERFLNDLEQNNLIHNVAG